MKNPTKKFRTAATTLSLLLTAALAACSTAPKPPQNAVYLPETPNGTYKNPVIYADYSDPDVTRVGKDFYLVASSFTSFPGLPILHSTDLVNWTIIGHALPSYPLPGFDYHVNGNGVWAPAIRYHNGFYYVYFGDPDNGVFMVKAKNPAGPWSPMTCIKQTKGWIDTCPFWDDDGNAYLVHGYAGSRHNNISNILDICRLSPDGSRLLDDGKQVIAGKDFGYTTVEGPKLYKRNGYYYIMAPGGGVTMGYQIVFRSRNIYGPYESRVTLRQGDTDINGPHQGGWVTTPTGQDWFLHFTDRGAYGRVTVLEPMSWKNDWPLMGKPLPNDPTCGEPVMQYAMPTTGAPHPIAVPQTSDEFNSPTLGLQWQWFGNYKKDWISLSERPGFLRMRPVSLDKSVTLFDRPNLLLQKLPAPRFTATTKIQLSALDLNQEVGLLAVGSSTAALHVQRTPDGLRITRTTTVLPPKKKTHGQTRNPAEESAAATQRVPLPGRKFFPGQDVVDAAADAKGTLIYLRIAVEPRNKPGNPKKLPLAICTLSYSTDGAHFTPLGSPCAITNNGWIGAKIGLFCNAPTNTLVPATGYADVDWFRLKPQ